MSYALATRPEASRLPERLDFKTAESTASAVLDVDETDGIITAIVSVTGVVDEVDDIILPGAYAETLAKRNPKVVWAHSWSDPIGKVKYIEELLPGDKRLPDTQRDGTPWPREAGALVAAMQFNLRSTAGKEAFEIARFYSESGECEYSIGYMVPPGRATKDKSGTRLIKMLELYELSVVLFGAHTMTGTLSIKSIIGGIANNLGRKGVDMERLAKGLRSPSMSVRAGTGEKAKNPFAKADGKDEDEPKRDANGNLVDDDGNPIDEDGNPIEVDADGNPVEKAAGGDEAAAETAEDPDADPDAEKDAEGDDEDEDALPTPTPLGGAAGGAPGGAGLAAGGTPSEAPETGNAPVDHSDGIMVAVFPDSNAADAIANHIAGPDNTEPRDQLHVTLGYLGKVGEMQTNEQDIYNMLVAAVDGQPALTGEIGGIGQFPAGEDGTPTWAPVDVPGLGMLREQVVAALGDMVWTEHGFTPHMTLGYDIGLIQPVPATPVTFTSVSLVFGNSRRDISLGAPVLNPDDGEAVKGYDPTLERKAEGGADRNRGGAEELREYWLTGEGGVKIGWGTPGDFTRCVSLLEEHMPGRAEGYCANRHKDATGMWPGDRDNKGLDAVPLLSDTKPTAPEVKAYPQMPGSFEERQQAIMHAIASQYEDDVDDNGNPNAWVDVRSTWPDSVLYGVSNYRLIGDSTKWFMVTYEYADDVVTLGEPQAVDLAIVPVLIGDDVEDEDWGVSDTMPLAEDILGMALTIKTAQALVTEGKAGRVLSGANERALRTAVEHLLAVLASTGLTIDTDVTAAEPIGGGNSPGKSDVRRTVDPRTDTATTSPPPAAQGKADDVVDIEVKGVEDNGDGTFTIDAKSLDEVLAGLEV